MTLIRYSFTLAWAESDCPHAAATLASLARPLRPWISPRTASAAMLAALARPMAAETFCFDGIVPPGPRFARRPGGRVDFVEEVY